MCGPVVPQRHVLEILCHLINKYQQIWTFNLTTLPLEDIGRRTAANLMIWIGEMIEKFDILSCQINAVVHDNGSNMVAAVRLLKENHGWSQVSSAGHTHSQQCLQRAQHQQSCWCCRKPSGALQEKRAGKNENEEEAAANENLREQADPGHQYEMEYGRKTPGAALANYCNIIRLQRKSKWQAEDRSMLKLLQCTCQTCLRAPVCSQLPLSLGTLPPDLTYLHPLSHYCSI